MRRLNKLSIVMLIMSLGICDVYAQFAGGSGTQEDPWLVANRTHLAKLNDYLGEANSFYHFKQIADIDLGSELWTPIGLTQAFWGNYDGDGYTISNAHIAVYSNQHAGLFAYVKEVELKNIYMQDAAIYPQGDIDTDYVYHCNSLLAGLVDASTIQNCHVSGSMDVLDSINSSTEITNMGILCGYVGLNSNIVNCSCEGEINLDFHFDQYSHERIGGVGGLIGVNYGNIDKCHSNANINFSLDYIYSTLSYLMHFGGFCATNYGTITNSAATGDVSGSNYVGGFVSYNVGEIYRCFASGDVSAMGYAGGFCSIYDIYAEIEDCYAKGAISFVNTWNMLGIIPLGGGFVSQVIDLSQCYSTGYIDAQDFVSELGGFAAYGWESDVQNCYWDTESSGVDYSYTAEGRTTDEMTYPHSADTYVNWDFTDTWMDDQNGKNDGYPFFKWQSEVANTYFVADTCEDFFPLTAHFRNLSSDHFNDTMQYFWDFGDGETSTDANPIHVFQNPGIYTVSLNVSNSFGNTEIFTRTDYVTVWDRIPTIELVTSDTVVLDNTVINEVSDYEQIIIRSIGGINLNINNVYFTTQDSQFELQESISSVILPHSEIVAIGVRFAPTVYGAITDTLQISSNDPECPILSVIIHAEVIPIPPAIPENVQISMTGYNAQISWAGVSADNQGNPLVPDYYLVFYNGSENVDAEYYYLGWTEDLSYLHSRVALHASHMLYRVRAYVNSSGEPRNPTQKGVLPGMTEAEVLGIMCRKPTHGYK